MAKPKTDIEYQTTEQRKTVRVPLFGSHYNRDYTANKDQRFVNCYPELSKNLATDLKKNFLVKRPGTTEFLDVGGLGPYIGTGQLSIDLSGEGSVISGSYDPYLVLWLTGYSFADNSGYNTVINEVAANILYGGYHGDGVSHFETGSNSVNFVLFNTSFTIEFSIKRRSNAYGAILGKARYDDIATPAPNMWIISMDISGPMKFVTYVAGIASTSLSGTIPPADDAFHTCKFTYDGITLKYYLDGVLDNFVLLSPFTDTTVDLGIMAEDSWPGPPFLGYGSSSSDYKAVLGYLKIWKGVVK